MIDGLMAITGEILCPVCGRDSVRFKPPKKHQFRDGVRFYACYECGMVYVDGDTSEVIDIISTVDPLKAFPTSSTEELINSLGYLLLLPAYAVQDKTTIKDALRKYCKWMPPGDLVFFHDDHCLAKRSNPYSRTHWPVHGFKYNGERCLLYENSLVSIISKDGSRLIVKASLEGIE